MAPMAEPLMMRPMYFVTELEEIDVIVRILMIRKGLPDEISIK